MSLCENEQRRQEEVERKHKEINTAVKIFVSLFRLDDKRCESYRIFLTAKVKYIGFYEFHPISLHLNFYSSVKITQLSLVILLGNDDPN